MINPHGAISQKTAFFIVGVKVLSAVNMKDTVDFNLYFRGTLFQF
jgi:hypothetical protein